MVFRRSAKKKPPRHDEITAFLGAGTQYNGQFNFQGIVRVDGGIKGDIISDGTLVLGEEGFVEGRIQVGHLVSNGRIVGDVVASGRVELNRNSFLKGNLRSPVVIIDDGAILNGSVSMGRDADRDALSSDAPESAESAGPGESGQAS